MILPDDELGRIALRKILEIIIHDLGDASAILLLQERINLYHRLAEATLAVKQVFESVEGGH